MRRVLSCHKSEELRGGLKSPLTRRYCSSLWPNMVMVHDMVASLRSWVVHVIVAHIDSQIFFLEHLVKNGE